MYHNLQNIDTLLSNSPQLIHFTIYRPPEGFIALEIQSAYRQDIQVDDMATLSGEAIEERIRIFATSVRKELYGFKPGVSWWVVKNTKETDLLYGPAKVISLLDQLNISEASMKNHLKSHWSGKIGRDCYTQYLRQVYVKSFTLVTVTMEHSNNNSSPIDASSKVVTDDADSRRTRSSYDCKQPWEQLRYEICENEIASLSSPASSPIRAIQRMSPTSSCTKCSNSNIIIKRRREVSPMKDDEHRDEHKRQKRKPTTLSYDHHNIKIQILRRSGMSL